MKLFYSFCINVKLISSKNLSRLIEEEDQSLQLTFNNTDGAEVGSLTLLPTTASILSLTEMNSSQTELFEAAVLRYCQQNLARLVTYLPSPYVESYITSEVTRLFLNMVFHPLYNTCRR